MEIQVNALECCPAGRARIPTVSTLYRKSYSVKGVSLSPLSFALALLLSLGAGPRAFAQQPTQWPQDDSYNSQYQPDQQSGYAQPRGYSQQQNDYPQQNYAQQNYAQPAYAEPGNGQQAQPLNAEQLEQIVAPIALYPDAVLAQILAASTYPDQVASADQWIGALGNAPPEQVAAGVSGQTSWDPSVKALTAFPQVLAMLDRNLQWTTTLGNAYYNQPQDVLQTVQVMRQRAHQAGDLESTPQENVNDNQGYIQLAPANSQVVYVPTYNPWGVYGQPVSPYPDFSPLDEIGSVLGAAVQYGLGFAVTAFTQTPFGLLSWGLDWLANSILFNHSDYYSHSLSVADWGFEHGGPRGFGRGAQMARFGDNYRHQPIPVRSAQGNNRGSGFPYARSERSLGNGAQGGLNRGSGFPPARPERSFGNQTQQGFNRGSQGYGYPRPVRQELQAYNHMPTAIGRPQPYGNSPQSFAGRTQQFNNSGGRSGSPSGYGSAFNPRPMQNYGGRQGMAYSAPSQDYRSLGSGYGRGGYGQGANPYSGFYGKSQRSGGFHPFGGGHSSQNFGGGGHAPKSFSFGGGHGSGGFGGHSGGGGHFGGGGHSGGHSGGGHSGDHGHSRR